MIWLLIKFLLKIVLADFNATAIQDPAAPQFVREIQVKGDYILGALATLFEQGYIDEETCSSFEARLKLELNVEQMPQQDAPRPPSQILKQYRIVKQYHILKQ